MIAYMLALVALHFIADFVCQTDYMALNKSKSVKALLLHTLVYSTWFLLFGVQFALITLAAHTVTDAVTSRITSKLWFVVPALNEHGKPNGLFSYDTLGNKRHWFFVVIGFDQLLHYTQLLLAGHYLGIW